MAHASNLLCFFGPFFGVWRFGSKHGWKHLEKGFKVASRWPSGVKKSLPGVLGPKQGVVKRLKFEVLRARLL
jgi:hypothetical protein